MKLSEVITTTKFNEIMLEIKHNWQIIDDMDLIKQVIGLINTELRNYEIGYKNPDEFVISYKLCLEKYLPDILNRVRFVKQSTTYLADIENWKVKSIQSTEFDTGYQGFNSPEDIYRQDTSKTTSAVENPIIFAQNIIDCFSKEMKKLKNEIINYLLVIY